MLIEDEVIALRSRLAEAKRERHQMESDWRQSQHNLQNERDSWREKAEEGK